ncbi:hypothetical protein O3M35_012761 [Rhynocoris fuscipes]|uniref:PAS domain-containing protein n=1 Tax=Rhynocoris fuscipes TaxID=488301 RepID=A0AAW1CWL2_9HEMI
MASAQNEEISTQKDINNENNLRNREKSNVYPLELNESIVDNNNSNNNNNNNNKIQNTTTKAVPQMRETLNIGSGILTNQSFISDHELKILLTDALDGFLFIARCDNGCVIYVNDTITKILNIRQDEWIAANFYHQIHPADVGKVKEQLNQFKSTVTDENDENDKKIFNCRMRLKAGNNNFRGKFKYFPNNKQNQCYALVQCKGFVRKLPANQEANSTPNDDQYCLVATARLYISSVPNSATDLDAVVQQFSSRHSFNGNFIFIDQRITSALGYTTVELLGKCFFNYFYRDDQRFIKETFKFIPSLKGKSMTVTYRFWSKAGYWVWLRISIYVFVNPYNNENEYIICDCTVLPHDVSDINDTGLQYFNMALANRSTGSYRQKERYQHLNCTTQNDLLTNNDTVGFLLQDTSSLTNELFNQGQTTTTTPDWSQFSGTIPSTITDWSLQTPIEMFQQSDWPLISTANNNWPITNDINNDLYQFDQSDIWQLNDDNTIWPKQLFENNNTFQQYQDLNQKSKFNWIDKENFENFSSTSTSFPYTATLRQQNQLFTGEYSGNSQQQNQRLWPDNDWLQNDLLTKSFNDLSLTTATTQSLTKPNFPWKTRDDSNIFQLSIQNQFMPTDVTCKSILQSAINDQSKLNKLPDLIEQYSTLHVCKAGLDYLSSSLDLIHSQYSTLHVCKADLDYLSSSLDLIHSQYSTLHVCKADLDYLSSSLDLIYSQNSTLHVSKASLDYLSSSFDLIYS